MASATTVASATNSRGRVLETVRKCRNFGRTITQKTSDAVKIAKWQRSF
jgi:hypothetical protein